MTPRFYKHYLLVILTGLALFNYVDRMALGIVLQDIKTELDLTDTQLGFLGGIAFALFYSVMGIPIARWADRGNRITIISLTTALWSTAVVLCGMANSFVQLLLIRIGVGVGEAGCMPPAFSLISDYFSRAERPRAFAIYGMGSALSFVVGFFLAGWLNELYGWRVTFMLLGLPGLLLALMARLTLREPRLIATEQQASSAGVSAAIESNNDVQPRLSLVFLTLWENATFRNLLLCNSVIFLFGYGILQWQPVFFIRSYGFTTGQIGTWMAVTYGLGGLAGMYLGGAWAMRYASHDERLQLKVMALALATAGVLMVFVYLLRNPYWAFALIGPHVLLLSAISPILNATIQTLVPQHMRAISVAVVSLVSNLIGMGLGPLIAGALSDSLREWVGEESLRYALMLLAPGYLWGAWHAWQGSKTVMSDLAKVPGEHGRASYESQTLRALHAAK